MTISKASERVALAIVALVVREALAERPVPVHDRHADRGIGVEHLLGRDHLDLVAVDVEAHLAEADLGDGVVGVAQQIEVPLRPGEQRLRRLSAGCWDIRHGHRRLPQAACRG